MMLANKTVLILCAVLACMSLNVAGSVSDNNLLPVDSSSAPLADNTRQTIDQATSEQESKSELESGDEGEYNDASAHLRLYYKSNSPFKYVSHEIEQKYDDQPEYGLERSGLYGGSSRYYPEPNDYQQQEKKRRTMLNLHYHGNSIDGLDTILSEQRMQQDQPHVHSNRQPTYEHLRGPMPPFNTIQNEQRRKLIRLLASRNGDNSRARIDNTENTLYRSPYIESDSSVYGQYSRPVIKGNDNTEDNLHYNIVHLKLRPDLRSGRLVGQGMVESDGYVEPRKVSALPKEIPDLIQNLLRSTNVRSNTMMSKRSPPGQLAESVIPVDESIVSKRSSEPVLDSKTTTNKPREPVKLEESEKNRDKELAESFKSLQRRHLDENDDDLSREARSEDELASEETD